jgi:hypothetical protein
MKKRIKLTNQRAQCSHRTSVESAVHRAFTEGFKSVLHDITYRIDSLMNMGLMQAGLPHRITSEMLNLARPILDGFTISDNSPSAGSIAWADCNIVYKGTKHTITNGTTNLKYVYWTLATTPTTFKTSATKPTLTDDDILISINDGGIHRLTVGEGRMVNGAAVLDGSISSGELGSGAVTTASWRRVRWTARFWHPGMTNGQSKIGDVGQIGMGAVDATALGVK